MDAMEETGRQKAYEYSWWEQVPSDSGMGRTGLLIGPLGLSSARESVLRFVGPLDSGTGRIGLIYWSYRTRIGPLGLRCSFYND